VSDALRRLAVAHGIALDYHDIRGTLHRVQDATLRALLGAMGVVAGSDAEAAAALGRLEIRRWRERIAPLTVVRTHARPWRVRVHLSEANLDKPLSVRLVTDAGSVLERPVDRARVALAGQADVDGERVVAVDVELAFDLPIGYHTIALIGDDEPLAEGLLAVAPAMCYRPTRDAATSRSWGPAVQLYGLRSPHNWGIGDFGDLQRLIEEWGAAGAGVVGVNPLHALFPHDPAHASPYSPSSRLFQNVLYLDVAAIAELCASTRARERIGAPAFQARLQSLRDATLVDYPAVAAVKHEVLEILYDDARRAATPAARERWMQFEAFRAAGGESLRRHARFEALQEHFHRGDPGVWGWPVWPEAYRDPATPAVQRFAEEHAVRVDYFAWLQWQAALQRAAVAAQARASQLGVGLYVDLAVSVNRGGAEAWANQDLYATAASAGAPADEFEVEGQDWGLPPLIPERLHAAGYAPFIATLRASMREAGALRIDHVMALQRLYWVPAGSKATEGAYVRYPFDALVGLLALESHRHRCLVIGEDLGTVPDGLRHALAANDILSYRVLLFERDAAGDFKPPQDYPEAALATASTHDLPTLAGWWAGDDLRLRAALPRPGAEPDLDARLAGRAAERARMLAALERAGVLPAEAAEPVASLTPALAIAVQRFLARTPSALMVVQLEDVFGCREQANLPGTTDAHPNWRRKLLVAVGEHATDPRFAALAACLRAERPRAARAEPAARVAARTRKRAVPKVALPLAAIPRSTYRVQLHREFGFDAVTALVPYFAKLGISHVYCSPYLRARPGSRHGYDIVDHGALNPEIGSRDDFERMADALARHGMSHLCDVVPNHMAVMGEDNRWWMDVLENGRASAYADFFDIDWRPPDPALRDKVLVPVLGEAYGAVLERGELRLAYEPGSGTFAIHYFEHRFPIDPRDYVQVLDLLPAEAHPRLDAALAGELRSLAQDLRALPTRTDTDSARVAQRRAASAALKAQLAALARRSASLATAIERAVAIINGSPAVPASHDRLHELLEAQCFRLAHWRVAADEINYRRFFDINDLAALRMESDAVFDATHRFVLELAARGRIGGLRIDHPDGLFDPEWYFERIQSRYRELAAPGPAGATASRGGIYVVLEKISAPHEPLPASWPVHGDTGYSFANAMNAVLIDPTARLRVERVWRAFVGDEARDYEAAAYEGKRAILRGALAAGLTTLAGRALELARADRRTRDFTLGTLRQALAETVAWFPVYRTYVSARGSSAQDRRYIDWAVARARRMSRAADPGVFDFVRALLRGDAPADAVPAMGPGYLDFAMRFQQYTAPVTAKGVEDTSFYTHTRLVSLNDVGSDPDQFGMTRRAFHRTLAKRSLRWPWTLLATSTHDNKRSEDVRARIDVISERPATWRHAVLRWSRINRLRKREVDGLAAPSRNDEYLLYQTLIGSFPPAAGDDALPAYRERIERYMIKAAREAKLRTSWMAIDEEYESALRAFVADLLTPRGDNPFLDELRQLSPVFAWFGLLNSLSMALIKLTAPGVPDIYQGQEMLDYSLVDPDNRRPVDFATRTRALAELHALGDAEPDAVAEAVREWFETPYDGRTKLWLTHRALAFRNRHPALVAHGDYTPIDASGARARHVIAFARRHDDAAAIVVAGRLYASLDLEPGTSPVGEPVWGDGWVDVAFLPDGTSLTNVLTHESLVVTQGHLPLARIFATFPAALLVRQSRERA
jgi:(1->4)-alpha-D-glucan 1-alpha-D-glucosylmutase